ncbi:hypothetical protein GCM10009619_17440 [Williamsia maris]|uniref:Uncharacterized protein n=1 Tax=Williamsia maris TaxID=72806 RepID=A0ABT1HCB5_9NOCA|nr:hypothetical protein [Williamsia maris]
MTPRDELLTTGRLGGEGAQLLYETVRLASVAYRFPPPDGHAYWEEGDIQAAAHEFLQGERGARRLLDLAVRSVDGPSFSRLLTAAVRNFLRDQARSTELGKLIVRLKSVLRDESEFVEIPRSGEALWTTRGGDSDPSVTSPAALAAVTRHVEVVVPKWTSETRDAPLADRDSLIRLIRAVLEAAAGSLDAIEIAHALAARLELRRAPLTLDLDGGRGYSEPVAVDGDPASATVSAVRATEIFQGLSDRERIIVATVEDSIRDLGALIGTGKSQAAHLRQRLFERMAGELRDDDQPEETVGTLIVLCDDWVRRRTGTADAPSK